MRVLLLLTVALSMVACASKPSVSTSSYQDRLKQYCLDNLSAEQSQNEDFRSKCVIRAMTNIHLAEEIYDTKADQDYADCSKSHSEEDLINQCFIDKKSAYFERWTNDALKRSKK